MTRPGVMIRGKVVMAPGCINTITPVPWVEKCRVYVNGLLRHNVIGYDEQDGEAIVRIAPLNGGPAHLQLLRGKVEAVPRH